MVARKVVPSAEPCSAVAALAVSLIATGCVVGEEEPFVDHEEPSDLVFVEGGAADGVRATFDEDDLMADSFFTAGSLVDGDGVQSFLERTPYGGRRCWLADHWVGSQRAADAIATASAEQGINPIVMVARLQVEKSLISRTTRPASRTIDFAFGCGCPDGSGCSAAYRGLDKQIACAAGTLRRHYDRSVAGNGSWRAGRSRTSLDGVRVTPVSHATASLYAYTPWVLRGRGGNWLVWNVTRMFENHFVALGIIDEWNPDPPSECTVDGTAGRCINVATCNTTTHRATPGHCPGPRNIQCCTPLGAAACGADAAEGVSNNDTRMAAVPLRTHLGEALRICEADHDYFYVDLSVDAAITISASFSTAGLDVDLEMIDPSAQVFTASSEDPAVETIALPSLPESGRYLLHVYARAGGGTYWLNLTE